MAHHHQKNCHSAHALVTKSVSTRPRAQLVDCGISWTRSMVGDPRSKIAPTSRSRAWRPQLRPGRTATADRLRARARMSAILGTWPWDSPCGFYAPCGGGARPVRLQLACGLHIVLSAGRIPVTSLSTAPRKFVPSWVLRRPPGKARRGRMVNHVTEEQRSPALTDLMVNGWRSGSGRTPCWPETRRRDEPGRR